MKINSTTIKKNSKPYIIAEIGSNFDQSIEIAKQLIDVAKSSKANAVKFQLFKAKNLYLKSHPFYKIFKAIELKYIWLEKLKKYANNLKLDFIVSPFDLESAKFLNKINIDCFKIASSELTNMQLNHYIASLNKPVIISTGMSEIRDIETTLKIYQNFSNQNISILQCTSLYPTPIKYLNLNVIKQLNDNYNYTIGFSDHTLSNTSSITAVGLGSRIFEKHITLNKQSLGPDHFYALEPIEFKMYVRDIMNSFKSLGSNSKNFQLEERKLSRRKGIYAKNNIKKGTKITKSNIKFMSPPLGLTEQDFDRIKNIKATRFLKKNDPIFFKDFEQ